MSISLGVAPVNWSNDDLPDIGGNISLQQCLREAAESGYSGIELGNKFPTDAATLQMVLQQHNLMLASGWFSGTLAHATVAEEIARITPQKNLFQACGCTVMFYGETAGSIQTRSSTPLNQRPKFTRDEARAYYRRLSDLAKYMADEGVLLAMHYHMGTYIQDEDETRALMDHTVDELKLLIDTGHSRFAGWDALPLLRDYAARVVHVHAKDVRNAILRQALAQQKSFIDAVLAGVFTVPGDGDIDFQLLCEALVRMDYDGWIIVEAEQDPRQANPVTYARKGINYLRTCLQTVNRSTVQTG